MRRGESIYPECVVRKAVRMYARGDRMAAISAATGAGGSAIRRWVRQAGLPIRKTRPPGCDLDKAIAVVRRTGSISAAARELGVEMPALSMRLRRHGVRFPELERRRNLAGLRYSEEDKRRALEMYESDAPLDDIEAAIGCARSSILKWVRNSGTTVRPSGRREQYDRKEIVDLRKRFSARDVAEIVGCSVSTVHDILAGRQ